MRIAYTVLFALLLLARSATAADVIEMDSAWARVSDNGAVVDVFVNIRNDTDRNDAITGVTYFGTGDEVITARLVDRNTPISTIPIRQGHRVRLDPGGYSIRIIAKPGQFHPDQQINLAIKFSSTKEIPLQAIIRPEGRSGPPTSYYERPR